MTVRDLVDLHCDICMVINNKEYPYSKVKCIPKDILKKKVDTIDMRKDDGEYKVFITLFDD